MQRVDKIFKDMDKNRDQNLTYEEFVNGSKRDSAIATVSPFPFRGMFAFPGS